MKTKGLLITVLLIASISCKTSKLSQNSRDKQEFSTDSSQNSLDWPGKYVGILPCADCEGIQTEVVLHDDLTYTMSTKYMGKDETVFHSTGKFRWDKSGSVIILTGEGISREPNKYLVGENQLFKLDMKGNRIEGNLAESYVLRKTENTIVEKYWKLVELRGKKVERKDSQSKEPHLILKVLDNRLVGNTGCNSFNGTYELLDGNRIKFSKVVATMMICKNMEEEREFLDILQMADNYNNNGDVLILNRARMAPLARFEAVYLK